MGTEYLFWTDLDTIIDQYHVLKRVYLPNSLIFKPRRSSNDYTFPYEFKVKRFIDANISVDNSGNYEPKYESIYQIETVYLSILLKRIHQKVYRDNLELSANDVYEISKTKEIKYFNDKTGRSANRHQFNLLPNIKSYTTYELVYDINEHPQLYFKYPEISTFVEKYRRLLMDREVYLFNKSSKIFPRPMHLGLKVDTRIFLLPNDEVNNMTKDKLNPLIDTIQGKNKIEIINTLWEKLFKVVKYLNMEREIVLNNISCETVGIYSENGELNILFMSGAFYETTNPRLKLENDDFKYDYEFHDLESNVFNLSTLKNGYERDLYAICVIYMNILHWQKFSMNNDTIKWYNYSNEYDDYAKINPNILAVLYILETDEPRTSLNIENFEMVRLIEPKDFQTFLDAKYSTKRQRVDESDLYSSDSDMPIYSDSD